MFGRMLELCHKVLFAAQDSRPLFLFFNLIRSVCMYCTVWRHFAALLKFDAFSGRPGI